MSVKGKILITPRSITRDGHPSLKRLEEAGYQCVFCTPGAMPSEEDLLRLLQGCVGYLAGVEKVTARVLRSALDLRVISRNGTGVDNIDLNAARERNIAVIRAIGANARGVAELALAMILSLARSIVPSDRGIKSGQWLRIIGTELESLTLGIVGCGKIGRLLAKFALGLDMKVLAYDLCRDDAFAPSAQFNWVGFDELIGQSDVISLHCPPARDGKPLINADVIGRLKKRVILINTARHELIDADAALRALDAQHIWGIGVDVFENEPPVLNPLLLHERVLTTPHIGGFTDQSVDRAVSVAVDGLLETLR